MFVKPCLLFFQDAEAAILIRHQSRAWCWCMCLGLALMLSGVVVAEPILLNLLCVAGGQVYWCGVNYREEDFMVLEEEEVDVQFEAQYSLRQLEERFRILEEEQVEFINVPVPEVRAKTTCYSLLTAYLDLSLNKYMLELLINIKAGTYLPQSYLVHEEMAVTERIENVNELGPFIYNLCRGKETFRLQRHEPIPGMQKREALDCFKIRHFENKFVVETKICSF
uniref:Integral membrane protein 2 n=1 Tax=Neogobius melanostomus TaxID=47308 RepID=A0A8C6SEI1_9GOBI